MRLAAMVIAVMAVGCAQQAPTVKKPPPVSPSQDSAVVNAAMLVFFEMTDWNTDWAEGDYVVARPKWSSPARPVFEEALTSAIERNKAWKSEETDIQVEKLTKIKQSISMVTESFQPGELVAPDKLELDDRVVVSDVEWSTFAIERNTEIKNRAGHTGSIRVAGDVSPPCYSLDGRYAMVSVGAPWSMHWATIFVFLQHRDEGWKVACVDAIFYL